MFNYVLNFVDKEDYIEINMFLMPINGKKLMFWLFILSHLKNGWQGRTRSTLIVCATNIKERRQRRRVHR